MSGADRAAGASALFTDLYELSMAQVYVAEGLDAPADFELFFRQLGDERGYVLAAGLETVLAWLEAFAFADAEIDFLRSLGYFSESFLEWLAALRFTGDVDAMPEGTAVFPNEPLLRVRAPIAQAQILETRILNALHYESLVMTKAARMVEAAGGRGVVDFGARRAHGTDAAVAAARGAWIAGCGGTSNMIAGQRFGLPVVGTMAHSYIESYADEETAFRTFAAHYPETTLLVDTYDTRTGVLRVIRLAQTLGDDFRVRAIRIDSGDLATLSREARRMLDEAGLNQVRIMVSGGLSEHRIASLVADGAPIDGFGVGTDLVVSRDSPTLDFAYKLVAYEDEPRLKSSSGKATLPGRKQVYRQWRAGAMAGDTIATEAESAPGEPLLQPVMRAGQRLQPAESLAALRRRAQAQREALPAALRRLSPAQSQYPVSVGDQLQRLTERLTAAHRST
ncbi:MAG: nicotinate phosphoribosyltransferase [Halofilum sp. (in: g-proteobacteria)]